MQKVAINNLIITKKNYIYVNDFNKICRSSITINLNFGQNTHLDDTVAWEFRFF